MNLELIKVSDLMLACDNPVPATKEESNDKNINNILYMPAYVQKDKQNMMLVLDGKSRVKDFNNFNTDVMVCNVEYVEEFNYDVLKQIRR